MSHCVYVTYGYMYVYIYTIVILVLAVCVLFFAHSLMRFIAALNTIGWNKLTFPSNWRRLKYTMAARKAFSRHVCPL